MFHPKGPTFLELTKQALSSTERGYDMIAPKFDYTPFRTPDALMEPIRTHVGEVDRALDVCCGTGAAMRILKPLVRRELVGLDMSRGMMEEAARRVREVPGHAEVRFVRGDARAIPFDGAFDLVTCFGAFGHIERHDEPRFVDAIRRALVVGGRFAFVTAYAPPVLSARFLVAKTFNAVMRVRNALIDPPFIMYYLTFLLPDVQDLLERHGFTVAVTPHRFEAPFEAGRFVVATRRE